MHFCTKLPYRMSCTSPPLQSLKKSEPSTASAAVTRKMCFFSANVGRKSVCSMLHSLLILCVFLCVCWAAETRLSVSTLWLQ